MREQFNGKYERSQWSCDEAVEFYDETTFKTVEKRKMGKLGDLYVLAIAIYRSLSDRLLAKR